MKLATRAEVALIHDLRREAREAGLFVVERPDAWLLYRETPPRNVLVGRPRTLAGLQRMVRAAARNH